VQIDMNNYTLVIHPSPHLGALAQPPTPEVLRVKKRASTLFFSIVFILGLALQSFKEFVGASIKKGIVFMNILKGPLTFVFALKSLHSRDTIFLGLLKMSLHV
jgi:hypothetical protein